MNSAPLPAEVAVTSIYTCTDEYIQPYQTSIIPGATNIGLCDGFVGHFQFFYDPEIYLVMHGALVAPVAGDPSGPADGDPADPAAPGSTDSGGCAAGGDATGGAGLLVLGALLVRVRRRS
ncbi:MAG: hypothetical protein H0X17_17010 [Deltaproteobacteria bacterium]|nr:hypothetical protein [Deltaproteobacteria bacterium]